MLATVQAIAQLGSITTEAQLFNLADQIDATAKGPGGVLYSGYIGGINAENYAVDLAAKYNLNIIDGTQRGLFLSSPQFQNKLAELVPAADVRAATDEFWRSASQTFASSLTGKVYAVAYNPSAQRILADTEIPTILGQGKVTSINGIPLSQINSTNFISKISQAMGNALTNGDAFFSTKGWLEFSSKASTYFGLPADPSAASPTVLTAGGGAAITLANYKTNVLTNVLKSTQTFDDIPSANTGLLKLPGLATGLKVLSDGATLVDVGSTSIKAANLVAQGQTDQAAQLFGELTERLLFTMQAGEVGLQLFGPVGALAFGAVGGIVGEKSVAGIWNFVENVGRLLDATGQPLGTVPAAAQPYATSLIQAGMPVTAANAVAASVYGHYLNDEIGGKAESFSTYLAQQQTAVAQDTATQQALPASDAGTAVIATQENGNVAATVYNASGNPQYQTFDDPTTINSLNPPAGPADNRIYLKGTVVENATPEPTSDSYLLDQAGDPLQVFVGGGPVGYELDQGGTFTNPAGSSITGSNYGVWMPSGPGTVINSGSIIGMNAAGIAIGQAGDVSNSGLIEGANGISVGGAGTLGNAGTVIATNGTAVSFSGSGSVTNNAGKSIKGTAGGVIITGALGTVINSGTILASSASGVAVELSAGGTVDNATTAALIEGGEYGVWMPSGAGTVTNLGSIIGTNATAISISGNGTITNDLLVQGANGISTGGAGTLGNAGTVTATNGTGVTFSHGGSVTNNAGKSIKGTAGGVIIIGASGDVTNNGSIVASSSSGVGVELGAGGTVDNATSATLIEGGEYGVWMPSGAGTVTNLGSIIGTNAAAISISGNGTITNDLLVRGANGISTGGAGTLGNAGTVTATNGTGVTFSGGGSVTNNAGKSIKGTAGGVIIIGASGDVTNNGSIVASSSSGVGVELGAGGTVDNATTAALIEGGEYGVWMPSGAGTVTNLGSIIGTNATAISISGNGTITNDLLVQGANGISTGGAGTLGNAGTVTATNGTGVTFSGGGSVTNNAGKSINGTAGGVIIIGAPGNVTNNGSIVASSSSGVGVELGAGGTVDNATIAALIEGGEYGVWMPSGAGTVTNLGSIIGTNATAISISGNGTITNDLLVRGANGISTGGAGTLGNAGTVTATNGTGVTFSGGGSVTNNAGKSIKGTAGGVIIIGASGDVTNNGSIVASSSSGVGVELGAGGTVDNATTAALIEGGEYGVWMPSGAGTVTNLGSIIGTNATAISISGNGTITNDLLVQGANGISTGGAGTLGNAGTVTATNGTGVTFSGGGSVTNNAGKSINGTAGGVIITGASGDVTNNGSIVASSSSGVGVELGAGGTVDNATSATLIEGGEYGVWVPSGTAEVTNNGTIQGGTGVAFGGSGSTLTTAGKIIGTNGVAVSLGSGNHLVIEPGATFVGKVVDPGGSDALELGRGVGSLAGLGTSFVDFGTVVVDAGGSWTLPGASSANTLRDDGTTRVGAGGRLAVATIDPDSTGVFVLGHHARLDVGEVLGTGTSIKFLGSDTLVIDHTRAFGIDVGSTDYGGPRLEDFTAGDTIDLRHVAPVDLHVRRMLSSGRVEISSHGIVKASLLFQPGDIAGLHFHAGPDGHGGSLLSAT